jgi:PKD repeat protein
MKHTKIISLFLFISLVSLFACQEKPAADFTVSKTATVQGDTILFNNLSTNTDHYEWNFGDSTGSNEKDPVHSYKGIGKYNVILYCYSSKGNRTSSLSQMISIGPSPSSAFTYSPRFPKPGEQVRFLDNSNSNTSNWLWDFGDGTTSTEKTPNHSFNSEKKYQVKLTVSNDFASFVQADSVIVLNITPTMPVADFSHIAKPGYVVDFKDESMGNPTAWLWSFGDGGTSNLQNPTHNFMSGGVYNVILRVYNLKGSSQVNKTVNMIGNIPEANFIYSEEENNKIIFTDKSIGNPVSWFWDFGDGETSALQDPIHQYPQINNYDVKLLVSNIYGSSQIIQTIKVGNNDYSFLMGNYNIVDENAGGPIYYTDLITPSLEIYNKFFTSRFENLENAVIFFLASGTTITIPSQTIRCGTPPNDIDHNFYGSGYYVHSGDNLKIYIDYHDNSSLGNFRRSAVYTKIVK